jgi:FeS assembly protein IscX
VRFTDLHKAVMELPDLADDPKKSDERILEAIKMAWYEEWQSEYGE